MDEMLKALYDNFYKPSDIAELKQETEDNHRLLIARLEKLERKMVLRIIDAKDSIAGQLSRDSFICGFKLAWRLSIELDHDNDNRRSTLAGRPELDACSIFREEEMKMPLTTVIAMIAACAALCAPVRLSKRRGEESTETQAPAVTAQIAEVQPLPAPIEVLEPAAAQSTEPEEIPPYERYSGNARRRNVGATVR